MSRLVLVTGAAGFIGAHCTRALLDRGDRVIGLDNLNPYYDPLLKQARLDRLIGPHPGFRFARADVADAAALEAALAGEHPTHILHLGAQAGVRHSLSRPLDTVHNNVTGQVTVLDLARKLRVRHMVYASSSSVYGEAPLPFDAERPADWPLSLYAASKRAAELMAEAHAHLHRIPLTGLRYFTVYGPWGRPDMAIWRFTERLLDGEPLPFHNGGEASRDFTHIDDIVAGTLAALDRPPSDDGSRKPGGAHTPHAIYNLGNDRPEPLDHLARLLARACATKPRIEALPAQPGDVPATWADIGPARRDLGYAPRIRLETGLPKFVDWLRGWRAGHP